MISGDKVISHPETGLNFGITDTGLALPRGVVSLLPPHLSSHTQLFLCCRDFRLLPLKHVK